MNAVSATRFRSVVVDDAGMLDVVDADAALDRVYSGALWCEGPVWSTERSALLFSDVRRNRQLQLGPHGDASIIRAPSNYANGNAVDAQGRLVSCEHLGRRIVRLERDGAVTVLADRFHGRPLNSPNDLAIHPDGSIWFTDPTFGLTVPEEGRMARSEQRGRFVFRLGVDGELSAVADGLEQPNGIVFSPDRRTLYVSDTSDTSGSDGKEGKEGKREINAFDVDGQRLRNQRLFAGLSSGGPDGLDVDSEGRLYAACGDGVRVWRADGSLLGRTRRPVSRETWHSAASIEGAFSSASAIRSTRSTCGRVAQTHRPEPADVNHLLATVTSSRSFDPFDPFKRRSLIGGLLAPASPGPCPSRPRRS